MQQYRRDGKRLPFHLSPAASFLKNDIGDNLHQEMTPTELWLTRLEYCEEWSLEEFRQHLYQEIDKHPKRAYRFERKKKAWKYPELHEDHPRLQVDLDDAVDAAESDDNGDEAHA